MDSAGFDGSAAIEALEAPGAVEKLALEPEEVQRAVLKRMTRPQKRELLERWPAWAHEGSCRRSMNGGSG